MRSNKNRYNFKNSIKRIKKIISGGDFQYTEKESIPVRSELTSKNGFYVKCCALFVDIRDSSTLPEKHNTPALAKIYKAFVSEVVAIINGNKYCKDIEIRGDSVSGIFDAYRREEIDSILVTAGKIISLIKTINALLTQKNITSIKVGIGIDAGDVLMIHAGLGCGLHNIVWMGDTVNKASNLCNMANKKGNKQILVSHYFYERLSKDYQNKFEQREKYGKTYYEGNLIINI